jgi:hypothetical protein
MAIQIIEENKRKKGPSVAQRLSGSLDVGLGLGSQLIQQYQQKKAQEMQMQEQEMQMQKEDQAFEALTGQKGTGLPIELKKTFLSEMLKGQNKINFENLKKGEKSSKETKEEESLKQAKDIGQKAFNGITNLLKKNNVGFGSNAIASLPFATETQHDVAEFTSLTGGLESLLVDMVSRGALSNSRFKYITETLLPKPNDRAETIKGKLSGLAQILGLDDSELMGNEKSSSKESNKKVRLQKDGKSFDIPENLVEEARSQGYA